MQYYFTLNPKLGSRKEYSFEDSHGHNYYLFSIGDKDFCQMKHLGDSYKCTQDH